ncbi:TIGR03960 family B12-binding radical SAM protein [Fusibacter ferrireducens]|uniref:TIGR03960 family B12-binding radical SAM protein n=1 Tax=Fusibacter ferrireducens TaxID=2785058 RepID=A0ABR9ZWM3_9FIRM|nr:TIGR03960 family B12-binding radical SAM protein [Fusibacter ferrireducens]MBF4694873.1 TIGR03960 family B12-binding radical SAM protein [Fusibacter ferrireducens]
MKLEAMLQRVEKPSRYIGGEINTFNKEITAEMIRFAFCFPDVYEVGMSYLGLQIIYSLLNKEEDVFCERVFSPWKDMEELIRENNQTTVTLETKSKLLDMDVLAFTLQYELSYTNIINMLDLSHIPFYAKDRSDVHPLIVAGGPCAYNPEPIADFVDLFFIGEGEEQLIEFIEVYRPYKAGKITKDEMLLAATKIGGVYVPKFYEPVYDEKGILVEVNRKADVPEKIKKRIVRDFDKGFQLETMIVPFADVVHDRAAIEIFRGCTKGCRFCQAGMIYRPVREKSPETIKSNVDKILSTTGFEEFSLTSLSTMDYSSIETLVSDLVQQYEKESIGVSLPSLRLDSFSVDVVKEIQKIRKTGLTFAPEAGTQRLRDVINKGVSSENIETTFRSIFGLGWSRVKLYFMIGLPTETHEDLDGISDIANLGTYIFKQVKPESMKKSVQVTVSTSCFVPKPFTPFQWMPQSTMDDFYEKIDYLKTKLINKKVVYNYHDPKTSVLEGVFARGDRKLSKVILKAFELGAKFDGWQEYFDYSIWMQAFEACGVDPDFYTVRKRDYNELFPWDIIDPGVTKDYLISENEKALSGVTTIDCREGCTACGVNVNIIGGAC